MSKNSNITDQDLFNLRNLTEQQINQWVLKTKKKRILKQAHDFKLPESLSPITKKKKLIRLLKFGTSHWKITNLKWKPHPSIIHTTPHQPLENNEGVIHNTELKNTLKNMKNETEFFQTNEDPESGWIWDGYPVKILKGTEV